MVLRRESTHESSIDLKRCHSRECSSVKRKRKLPFPVPCAFQACMWRTSRPAKRKRNRDSFFFFYRKIDSRELSLMVPLQNFVAPYLNYRGPSNLARLVHLVPVQRKIIRETLWAFTVTVVEFALNCYFTFKNVLRFNFWRAGDTGWSQIRTKEITPFDRGRLYLARNGIRCSPSHKLWSLQCEFLI